ncbi:MAG: hypothetical protein U0Q11_13640 [Vicinamibacterales bacterium]
MYDPSAIKPVLISDKVFADYRAAREAAGRRDPSPPLVNSINTMVLLPGPFGVCSPESTLHSSN